MYTCPEKDIHSIYLDNELPQTYVLEYESHIASCTLCRTQLLKLKQLSSALRENLEDDVLSPTAMDESFVRLQTKLHFSDTSKKSRMVNTQVFKWALPAAAIFAFALVLPLNIQRNRLQSGRQPAQASVPISIQASALGSLLTEPSASGGFVPISFSHQTQKTDINGGGYIRNRLPSLTYDTNTAAYSKDKLFATVDIFRPEFEDRNRISVKITLTNLGELPITTEFSLPARNSAEVYAGNQ